MEPSRDSAGEDDLVPLLSPPGGIPPLIDSGPDLEVAIDRLAQAGPGPVALDAERASGFRYGQRDYLVQVNRRGAGIVLIDPIEFPDLTGLGAALDDAEWVLHAAPEDLPGLADLGMRPPVLFYTELAGRLLGYPRTSLGTLVAELLGYRLAKEHSAADWSTRPLPDAWRNYAALDVAVLLDLRDALAQELAQAGKLGIAAQEFEAVRLAAPPAPKPEPWRRTSGSHQLRDVRRLAVLRSLWEAREAVARRLDLAPRRVVPDSTLIRAAETMPQTVAEIRRFRLFEASKSGASPDYWLKAVENGRRLPRAELPSPRGAPSAGPPPVREWKRRSESAAKRLRQARAAIEELSQAKEIPVEYLTHPSIIRQILWDAPSDVVGAMAQAGARPWQRDLVAPILTAAIANHPDR